MESLERPNLWVIENILEYHTHERTFSKWGKILGIYSNPFKEVEV